MIRELIAYMSLGERLCVTDCDDVIWSGKMHDMPEELWRLPVDLIGVDRETDEIVIEVPQYAFKGWQR